VQAHTSALCRPRHVQSHTSAFWRPGTCKRTRRRSVAWACAIAHIVREICEARASAHVAVCNQRIEAFASAAVKVSMHNGDDTCVALFWFLACSSTR